MAKYLDLTGLTSYDGKLKQWVNSVVDALKNGAFQVVEAVPEPSAAQPMTIYLVAIEGGGSSGNVYEEYILVDGAMEKIGTTEISLDGYATDDDLTQAINALKAELQQAINGKADSGHTHAEATGSAAGFMSAADKAKLDTLEAMTAITEEEITALFD